MRGTGSKFFYILAALALVILIFSGSNLKTIFTLRARLKHYREKIEEVRKENNKLKEELRLLAENPEHAQFLARKKLGMIKEGEIKYYIIESDKD